MLYNYKNYKAEIKNILLEIEDIENSYRGIGAIEYSDMPKAHNTKSSVEQEIEQKERRIEYLNQLIMKKENIIKRVDNVLEVLSERERILIEMRYFNKVSYFKIAEALDLDVSSIFRIRRETIDKITSLLFIN